MTTSSAGVSYVYDGDGNRVEKSNGTIYWYGAGGEVLDETDLSGNLKNEYVYFAGKRVAMRDVSSGNVYYYAADMLGSARTMVQAGQTAVCYDADFLPYGQEVDYTSSCGSNYKFEGKERDLETGNDNFGARYYRSALGRWMSADWSSVPVPVPYANLTNPQTLNLYAMVSDNPETFADLDGHLIPGGPYNLETGDISGTGQGPNCDYMGGNCSKQKNANTNVNGHDQDPVQKKAQPQTNIQRVGNIVDNETSGLRPSKTEGGSAQDLHNAKVDMAHVVLNREKAGINGGVALDTTTSREERTPQYRDAQAAAAEAARSPDPTHGSHNYVLDYGQRMPAWVGKMQTVRSFGPFVNGAGGGDVPKGAQVIIRILISRKPED